MKTEQRQPIYWNRWARREDCSRNQLGDSERKDACPSLRARDQYPKENPHLQLVPSPSHKCCGICAHMCLNGPNSQFLKKKTENKIDKKKKKQTKTSSKIASSVVAQPLTKIELLQNMARRVIGSKAFTVHFLPSHQVSIAEFPWGE